MEDQTGKSNRSLFREIANNKSFEIKITMKKKMDVSEQCLEEYFCEYCVRL